MTKACGWNQKARELKRLLLQGVGGFLMHTNFLMCESRFPHCSQIILCVYRSSRGYGPTFLLLSFCFIKWAGLRSAWVESDFIIFSVLSRMLVLCSWVKSQAVPMGWTNSLIFQLIKMSSSIQNSNLSYNLNSLPSRSGLIRGEEPAGRWGTVAASPLFLLFLPMQTPPEREEGWTKGRSQKGLTWWSPLQSGERLVLSPVQHFCEFFRVFA